MCLLREEGKKCFLDVLVFSATELLSLFTLVTKQGSQEKLQFVGYFIVALLEVVGRLPVLGWDES